MYFDLQPKAERKDLYGMDYKVDTLRDALQDNTTRMIIIKGLRRVGKTSLLNVGLQEVTGIPVKIDVRESPWYGKKEFFLFLMEKIKEKLEPSLLEKVLQKIAGVTVSYQEISLEVLFSQEEKISSFFAFLDKRLGEKGKKLVLAFDEAQLLKEIKFDYFLASIFDNYLNIKIILTGSEVGLLDKLVGKQNYDSPLFGRAYLEVELPRFQPEETKAFLEKGFAQLKREISFEEIREVIEHLDGIVGWLTHYGWLRLKGNSHEQAIQKTEQDGKELVWREVQQFMAKRRAKIKYQRVLKLLAQGRNSRSELLLHLKKVKSPVADSQLHLYLKELAEYNFIERQEGEYFIADPLLVKAAKEK